MDFKRDRAEVIQRLADAAAKIHEEMPLLPHEKCIVRAINNSYPCLAGSESSGTKELIADVGGELAARIARRVEDPSKKVVYVWPTVNSNRDRRRPVSSMDAQAQWQLAHDR